MDSNMTQHSLQSTYLLVTLCLCNFDLYEPYCGFTAWPKVQPQHAHDCDACEFLGRNGGHDLYVCRSTGQMEMIVRFGSEGPDYSANTLHSFLTIERHGHHGHTTSATWNSYRRIVEILSADRLSTR